MCGAHQINVFDVMWLMGATWLLARAFPPRRRVAVGGMRGAPLIKMKNQDLFEPRRGCWLFSDGYFSIFYSFSYSSFVF